MNAHTLKLLSKNDAATQQQVYYQHADRLMAIVLRYVPSVVDAEEVLQDSFIRVFEKIDSFDEQKGSFKAWSSKIAVNFALMFLRKKRKLVFYEEDLHAKILNINNEAVQKLNQEDINKQIEKLDEKYAVIFKLKAIEGYSHQEIAILLGIKKEASRTIFSRAKKQLRNMFELKKQNLSAHKKGVL